MNWITLLQGIIGAEQQVVPVFVKNPQSQNIAAVILVGEQLALNIAQALTEAQAGPKPPAQP